MQRRRHHPSSLSFAHIEAENVIIETIKKAEKSDDIILRLYEASGATTRTTLTLDREIDTIWRTNLLEEPEKSLDHQQKSVELTLSPFEILTLRVQFSCTLRAINCQANRFTVCPLGIASMGWSEGQHDALVICCPLPIPLSIQNFPTGSFLRTL